MRTLVAVSAMLLLTSQKCSEEQKKTDNPVLMQLFEKYEFGQIEECMFEGRRVYHASINAFDAGSEIYDEHGNSIASCNYMTKQVGAACEQLQQCETIYRCNKHMSGEPPVDKYGLDQEKKK